MGMTIQQAIDKIIASVPGAPYPDTVDTVKIGDPTQEVSGIVVTFLINCEVIDQAIQLGANFIITHEPTFYNHRDEVSWLRDDAVYNAKRQRLEAKDLVIWRFHDYLHSLQPDSTFVGLLKELGWETYSFTGQLHRCHIPPISLRELVHLIKGKLGIQTLRVVGDLEATCEYIGLLPGFPGPEMQIGTLGHSPMDVLITGEIHEWETSEYARDAGYLKHPKGLIILGHAASEEPGMKWIIPWIQERLPGIRLHFVSTRNPFQYL